MFAIVRGSGKQFKVSQGLVVKMNRMDVKEGDIIELSPVLMVGDEKTTKVGTPALDGAKVTAKVLEHKRDKKIIVFKKKRRQGYTRTAGHRQDLTILRIESISAPGFTAAKPAAAKKPAEKKEAAPAKKTEAKAPAKAPAKKAEAKTAAKKPAAKKTEAKK